MRIRDGIMDIAMNTGVKRDNMINKTGLSCIWRLKCILSFYFEFHIERKMQKGSNSARIVPNSRQLITHRQFPRLKWMEWVKILWGQLLLIRDRNPLPIVSEMWFQKQNHLVHFKLKSVRCDNALPTTTEEFDFRQVLLQSARKYQIS